MKKGINHSLDVHTWLEFANYDLKTAKWNLQGKIYTSACYASQQAAEKALKALILAQGAHIPKVHSLDRLITELHKLQIDTSEIKEKAQALDPYYISTRYPGQYGGPEGLYVEADAQVAIHAAEAVLEFVQKELQRT